MREAASQQEPDPYSDDETKTARRSLRDGCFLGCLTGAGVAALTVGVAILFLSRLMA